MRRTSFREMNCSVAQCLEAVGEWWSLLIVRDAFFGVTRFDDFQERLGMSRNVLTRRLQHLVAEGVLERRAYQDRPVRHDYVLSDKGRDLWVVLTAMRQWGDRWEAPDGPRVELEHGACGQRVHLEPSCSACHEPVGPSDVRVVPGPAADPGLLPPRG